MSTSAEKLAFMASFGTVRIEKPFRSEDGIFFVTLDGIVDRIADGGPGKYENGFDKAVDHAFAALRNYLGNRADQATAEANTYAHQLYAMMRLES